MLTDMQSGIINPLAKIAIGFFFAHGNYNQKTYHTEMENVTEM